MKQTLPEQGAAALPVHPDFPCLSPVKHGLRTLLLLLLVFPFAALAQYEQVWRTPPFGQESGAYKKVISSETDAEGNALILAETRNDHTDMRMVLYKYSADGTELWQVVPQQVNPELQEVPVKLRVDANGASYVLTNLLANSSDHAGAILSKISANGTGEWSRTFTSDNLPLTSSADLLVNEALEVFVSGTAMVDGNRAGVVKKLHPNGNTAWSRATPGETADALALAPSGDVVVAGSVPTLREERHNAYLATLHREHGRQLMQQTYNFRLQSGHSSDFPVKAHVTANGDILVLLHLEDMDPTVFNVLLMRTNSQGEVQWQQMVGNTHESRMLDAVVAENEEVVILGLERKYRQTADYFLTKVNAYGQKQWYLTFNQYNGSTINELAPADLDISPSGDIALTAHAAVFDEPPAWFIPPAYKEYPALVSILYNMDGQQVWENKYEPSADSYTFGRAVSFDAEGNLFVVASAQAPDASGGSQLVLHKFARTDACARPLAVQLYLPPHPVQVGEQVSTTADFGDFILTENTGIRWAWGEGSEPSVSYTAFGTARITGEHTYQEAGIYTVGLDFSESCLSPENHDYQQQMVIYDPSAGSVAGAGQVEHDFVPLKYVQRYEKTTFAFSVRYQNASSETPVGTTVLLLNNRNRFYSTSHDWLVVNGDRAAWKGRGVLDGQAGYSFLVTVADAGGSGLDDPGDRMRIQIWDSSNQLVYDTQSAAPQLADLQQPLLPVSRGQVIIHSKDHPLLAYNSSQLQLDEEMQGAIAYPNPFREKATVTFASMQPGTYAAELYDMKGALVKELQQGTVRMGEVVSIEVDGADLPAGVYFTRIATPDEIKTVKLILQR